MHALARKRRTVLAGIKRALDTGHRRTRPAALEDVAGSETDPEQLDLTIRAISRRLAGTAEGETP